MERDYLPCSPSPDCPYRQRGGCREDTHHIYHPGEDYQGTVEKVFRNLPLNKVVMCRRLHELEHQLNPPEKPDRETMLQTIIDADLAGQICLSVAKRRAVYGR